MKIFSTLLVLLFLTSTYGCGRDSVADGRGMIVKVDEGSLDVYGSRGAGYLVLRDYTGAEYLVVKWGSGVGIVKIKPY